MNNFTHLLSVSQNFSSFIASPCLLLCIYNHFYSLVFATIVSYVLSYIFFYYCLNIISVPSMFYDCLLYVCFELNYFLIVIYTACCVYKEQNKNRNIIVD